MIPGRRRQGKTYLLDALTAEAGGFYFAAKEATAGESLHLLGEALSAHLRLPAPLRLGSWEDTVDALLALGGEGPVPVVIDEFPYLARSSLELPSVIQKCLGPRRRERTTSRTRLILCGSALRFMGSLLSGSAPLRGRASLELVVPTLGFRQAARFWDIDDPRLAALTHAVVGGTPAYRTEFARGDRPRPSTTLTTGSSGRCSTRPAHSSERRATCWPRSQAYATRLFSTLFSPRSLTGTPPEAGIATYVGRSSSDLAHPLTVLEDACLLERDEDAFRPSRPRYRITEPLLDFYHAVMRPTWSLLGGRVVPPTPGRLVSPGSRPKCSGHTSSSCAGSGRQPRPRRRLWQGCLTG